MIRAAVIGDPISHSRSPELHRAAYQALGLESCEYEKIRIPEGTLECRYVEGSFDGLTGLSVTMPHKQAAARLATQSSPRVHLLGAANTLIFGPSGPYAQNTDVDGILGALLKAPRRSSSQASLQEPAPLSSAAHGIESMLILGGGGTAQAALSAAAELGVQDVALALRSPAKAKESDYSLVSVAEELDLNLEVFSLLEVPKILENGRDVVISTLPPRAADPSAKHWGSCAGEKSLLLDVAYDPWPSALVEKWSGPVVHGLEMLLYQALEQVRLMLHSLPSTRALNPSAEEWERVVNAMAVAVGLPPRENPLLGSS